MEITDFLEGILNKEEHTGDLLKKDKTYISLGNGNNNILIEYNGLNSYNFKVLDTGDIKLVEGRIEKIKGKSFIRESTIFNIDGSDKLRTVYYKTYKITSSQSKTNLNERNYYVLNCYHKKGGNFSDLIVKDKSYWKNFSPEDTKILKFTRNTKAGEISDFEGIDNSYSELKEARDSMLKDIDEEYRTTLINFGKYKLVMFAMAKLMEMETTEQNKVALYLFNTLNMVSINF